MKILWLCNIMLPAITEQLHMEYSVREGWLTGILSKMTSEKASAEVNLGICFPVSKDRCEYQATLNLDGLSVACYGFYEDLTHPERYDRALETRFLAITDDFKPDIVHIFGTEFPHTLAMTKAFPYPEKILIGLQGIISRCGEEYYAGLPEKTIRSVTFRDWLKNDSIRKQKEKFDIRGTYEKQALLGCLNVTGRTAFDKQMANQMNEKAVYYDMNETMRPSFYTEHWELSACLKHRIFFSQADYPLKGFHILLGAMRQILLRFPDAEIVVAGNSIVNHSSMKDRIKISAYGKYLRTYISEWELEKNIVFLGSLTEEEMKEQYLLCHTFVCTSVLENSPNSVAEAMLLGTPVVASRVGGIPSMVKDRVEGLLFDSKDSKELAECIIRLWEDDELAGILSQHARERACQTHNPETNYKRLLSIYHEMEETE